MKRKAVTALLLLLFVFHAASCTNQFINPISRTFEDLTLGMSETEFRHNLSPYFVGEMAGLKTYMVYAQSYESPDRKITMKELPNIQKVFCSVANGKLVQYEIYYYTNYQWKPSWKDFIHKTKQKYGFGKELGHEITWNDGKTTLKIKEEFNPSNAGFDWQNFIITYTDNTGVSLISDQSKQSSPVF